MTTADAKVELVRALTKCRDKFREYEGIHALKLRDYKGKEPLNYAAELQFKINRNREMAEMCDAALAMQAARPIDQHEALGRSALDYYHESTCPCVTFQRSVEDCPKHGNRPRSTAPVQDDDAQHLRRILQVVRPYISDKAGEGIISAVNEAIANRLGNQSVGGEGR